MCNQLFVINPLHVIDALDEMRSDVKRFSSGRIMKIDRYEFSPMRLPDIPLFKIPNLRASPTFVTDSFVAMWQQSELFGLEFNHVWPKAA
jgi:hypothetical protein